MGLAVLLAPSLLPKASNLPRSASEIKNAPRKFLKKNFECKQPFGMHLLETTHAPIGLCCLLRLSSNIFGKPVRWMENKVFILFASSMFVCLFANSHLLEYGHFAGRCWSTQQGFHAPLTVPSTTPANSSKMIIASSCSRSSQI